MLISSGFSLRRRSPHLGPVPVCQKRSFLTPVRSNSASLLYQAVPLGGLATSAMASPLTKRPKHAVC